MSLTFLFFMRVLQKRQVLEEAEMLDPRISALEEDLDEVESSEEEDEEEDKVKNKIISKNLPYKTAAINWWFLIDTFIFQIYF